MRFPGKATLLKVMLIFQMFPAVLALVASYALIDFLAESIPFIGLNTSGCVIFPYCCVMLLQFVNVQCIVQTILVVV
ncbi:maltose transporter subunit [Escherichia coli]|nr:maltose transporter subunit [Escherichia coli]